jgi:hypothetical protein
MIRNYSAVSTLIRNRLNDSNKPIDEKIHWFHEKGVSLRIEDENLFTLRTEVDGHTSELTDICQKGLIYRGNRLQCFMGEKIKDVSFPDLENYKELSLDEKSVFIQPVKGRTIYMYHDNKIDNWEFADDSHSKSSYKKIFLRYLYNIMMVDPGYSYVFEFVEKGEDKGIYLVDLLNTKRGTRTDFPTLFNHAMRLKVKAPEVYFFEGLDKLSTEDLPIYLQDSLMRRIRIIK